MGITLTEAVLLQSWARRHALRGRVLTLGVQQVDFTAEQLEIAFGGSPASSRAGAAETVMSAEKLFARLDFEGAVSADVSAYEGADVILDLNTPEVPPHLKGSFGLVVNGGTLEHVFHVPNALSNLTRMLAPGGSILHIMPCHNCVDHGFYQFGPTLIFDYYAAAHFEVLESAAIAMARPGSGQGVRVFPVPEGGFGIGLIGAMSSLAPLLYIALVRKTAASLDVVVPTQRLYRKDMLARESVPNWFAPFSLVAGGQPVEARVVERRLASFSPAEGLAWSCPLPDLGCEGDALAALVRSPLMLFEDGRPLGPPHASHAHVIACGGGAFSHWGDTLLLSTSDGTDPRVNGRAYVARAPAFPAP